MAMGLNLGRMDRALRVALGIASESRESSAMAIHTSGGTWHRWSFGNS